MTELQAISLFKCLADKSRIQILKSLMEEDMYVERLSKRLGLTPATISFHLKKLVDAGASATRPIARKSSTLSSSTASSKASLPNARRNSSFSRRSPAPSSVGATTPSAR